MKTILKFVAIAVLSLLCTNTVFAKSKTDRSKSQTIRFMDYNIADGMWFDQFGNYDRFVTWMQGMNTDIFAICEGATHWDKNKKNVPKNDDARYLPAHLEELAARWGHSYVAVGPYQDNYPVAFTSRFPIEVVQRIGGDKVSHGALHVKIGNINYVVLHLWPQRYAKGDKTRKGNGGDAFRLQEIEYILDMTIRNPKYKAERHWIMCGDFNSRSPLDEAFYNKTYKDGRKFNYDVHNAIRQCYANDAVGDKHPDTTVSSTSKGVARIDIIYCTPKVYAGVKSADAVRNDFTRAASDHLPVLMEFKAPKK